MEKDHKRHIADGELSRKKQRNMKLLQEKLSPAKTTQKRVPKDHWNINWAMKKCPLSQRMINPEGESTQLV